MPHEYKDMMKMMNDKKGKKPDSEKNDAKRDVIKDLRNMAMGEMGKGFSKGMKEVRVSSDSKEGLEEGLDKAGDMLEGGEVGEMMANANKDSYEPDSDMDEEYEEYETVEEIDAKIAELMKLKMEMEG